MALLVVILIIVLWATSIRATYNYATWRGKLRRLWAERVFWTREYMISVIEDLPNKSYVADKLMQNQDNIGKTAGMYYGKCQGEYLANLLKTHITIATQTIESIKNKNDVETKKNIDIWRKNSHEIESYLNIGDEMQKHLDLTVDEIRTYLGVHDGSKGRGSDIPIFDATLSHSLVVADKMSQKALSSKWFWFFVHSLVLIE